MKIAILISGRGSNMLAITEAAQNGQIPNAEISIVVSDRADAAGVAKARARGVEAVEIERKGRKRAEHDAEIVEVLRDRGVELVCLAGYMRLLSPEFVNAFAGKILNIHPSLLPAFPGLHAQRQALEYGVKVAGCSVHLVDESLDGGPIIAQAAVPVLDDDSEATLTERILAQEHRLYAEALSLITSGAISLIGRRVVRRVS